MMEKSSIERCKTDVEENLREIRENIAQSAVSSGRNPDEITLLAVTKTVPPWLINHAISLGVNMIGENRVQEFLSKEDELNLENCGVHIIGHLQTNKVKYIAGKVQMIESVDSVRLASEISRLSLAAGVCTDVLIEVNIGGEESKSGVKPEQTLELIEEISKFKGISVKGLMTIPPICDIISRTEKYFSDMNKLFIDIGSKNIDNVDMKHLSMGMSADYREAIKHGATTVRVGTALFGSRKY
ncbi:MAG: YggS family pyridoxal phosphate-dependent enzyme [Clostridia bacterium]|nr:YggS family pyridoxal phosphate-dependent enzyme [Clostridia bacterium]MBQ6569005.1 YggS family pyridoxal phosphate-dependent enzyme [Clostridia bacterium]